MTPTDFAVEELALWEQALREQREAEQEFDEARRGRQRVIESRPQLQALRTRADLLLAGAVKVKCSFAEQKFIRAWGNSTQPDDLQDGTSA